MLGLADVRAGGTGLEAAEARVSQRDATDRLAPALVVRVDDRHLQVAAQLELAGRTTGGGGGRLRPPD